MTRWVGYGGENLGEGSHAEKFQGAVVGHVGDGAKNILAAGSGGRGGRTKLPRNPGSGPDGGGKPSENKESTTPGGAVTGPSESAGEPAA